MDIHLYVRGAQGDDHEVGRMLCPVVPRIGETIYLRMSLMSKGGIDWQLNPASDIRFDTAYFVVDDVAYDGYNVAEIEEGMGSAPVHEGSAVLMVILYVHAKNDDTQVYIDRAINSAREHQTMNDEPQYVLIGEGYKYLKRSKPTGDRIILQEIEAGRLAQHEITDQETYVLREDLERLRERLDGR